MTIIDVKNIIRKAEKQMGEKFENLFDERQQEEIMDFLVELDEKTMGC